MARPESTRNPDGAQESAQGLQLRGPQNQNESQQMFLRVEAKSATLHYEANGSAFRTLIIFNCTARPESSNLEIGPEHVFGHAVDRDAGRSGIHCELTIRVERRSVLSAESVEEFGLTGKKIGELIFFPDIEPPALEVFVYFNDDLFADVANALIAGRTQASITLSVEREDVLAYVRGSDHRWIKWKITDTESHSVDVTALTISLPLFG